MQDIIQKMIDIDRQAQKLTDDALALRRETEVEIKNDQKALREKYIADARQQIQKNSETEEQNLNRYLEEIEKKYAAISKNLDEIYEQNHDKWVEEMFKLVVSG